MSTTISAEVDIARPPHAVAAVVLDPDKAVLWNSGLERFEVVARPPQLVGSKARLHFRENGRAYVMEDELLEVTPDRRFHSRVSGDELEADVETTLEPTPTGTRVTVTWSGQGRRFPLRWLMPLMRGSIARGLARDLAKLKAVVERG